MDYKMDFTGSQKQLQIKIGKLRNNLQMHSTTDFWEQILIFMILTIFKNSWKTPAGKPIQKWK